MVRALELRKFIEDGKWWHQGRVRGAKIGCSRNFENEEFCRVTLAEGTCLKFCGPAGGCSLSARIPLMAEDMACGDDSFFVSRIVQAILLSGGAFAKLAGKWVWMKTY